MKQPLTSAYTRFEDLKKSSTFLELLLNNISSCILMLDKEMKLQAFNEPLKTIFRNKSEQQLLYQRCGEVIGCAYSVEEKKDCGKTNYCNQCILRLSAMNAYATHKSTYNQKIIREFYSSNNTKETKCLKFSVKPIYFEDNYYLIMIIDDVSKVVGSKAAIEAQQEYIKQLKPN